MVHQLRERVIVLGEDPLVALVIIMHHPIHLLRAGQLNFAGVDLCGPTSLQLSQGGDGPDHGTRAANVAQGGIIRIEHQLVSPCVALLCCCDSCVSRCGSVV